MKLARILSVIVIICSFQACITIEENYTFSKKGSGTMEYVIDMTEFGKLMETMGEMAEEAGSNSPEKEGNEWSDLFSTSEDGDLDFLDSIDALDSIPGISKVKSKEEDFKAQVSFAFKNLEALNAALNVIMPDTTGNTHTFFKKEDGLVKRYHNQKGEMSSAVEDDGEDESAAFLKSMRYKISVKGPAVSVPNPTDATITQVNKKEVLVESKFSELVENPSILDVGFKLSK